jgi:hypothetical protein
MVAVGETYTPSGKLELYGVVMSVLGGALAAAVCGGVILGWELSGIPVFIIIAPLLQGLGVGAVLYRLFGLAKLRNPTAGLLVGLACGVFSVGIVHYGNYVYFVRTAAEQQVAELEKDADIPADMRTRRIAAWKEDPYGEVDRFFAVGDWGSGFLGYMKFRAVNMPVTVKNLELSGGMLWGLWTVEGLFVFGAAGYMARNRTIEIFCEDCGMWASPRISGVQVRSGVGQEFQDAVQAGDPNRIAAVAAKPGEDAADAASVLAGLHICPQCRQTFVDVISVVPGDKGNTETVLVGGLRVSPETAGVLQSPELIAAALRTATPAAPDAPAEPTDKPPPAAG